MGNAMRSIRLMSSRAERLLAAPASTSAVSARPPAVAGAHWRIDGR